MSKIKVGIDSSTTNTAVVLIENDELLYYTVYSPKQKDILERSAEIVYHITKFFNKANLMLRDKDIVVGIESASFHSKGMRDKLTMLLGAIYYNIKNAGFSVKLLPPSTIKKQFTSNGRATKFEMEDNVPEEVMQAFNKISKKTDDLVDAYAIACIL